jgi:hypothetical protein
LCYGFEKAKIQDGYYMQKAAERFPVPAKCIHSLGYDLPESDYPQHSESVGKNTGWEHT